MWSRTRTRDCKQLCGERSNWYKPPGGTVMWSKVVGLSHKAVALLTVFLWNRRALIFFLETWLFLLHSVWFLKKKQKKTFLFQFFCARKSHAICTDCKGFFQVFDCDVQKKLYWVPFWCRWIVFYYLFAECEMCNSFSLVCYLTSRMYDGGVCFCFIFVCFFLTNWEWRHT